MICNETHDLLDGFVDAELDLVRSIEVEKHVQSCRACSRRSRKIVRRSMQASRPVSTRLSRVR